MGKRTLMTDSNDLTQVVMRTAYIENLLNQVIEGYCAPRNEAAHFFWSVLLDSSIIQLGAKIKASLSIAHEMKVRLDRNSLYKLVSFRNAFAHHKIDSHPTILVNENREEDELHFFLEVLSSSGKIERIQRENALADFNRYYEKCKVSLGELLDKIKSLS